ncbi:MAG TPA: DUF6265 family protein [Gemmatimonadota bacterium]|nr:DUF6265 family protein [Gemmatimonadota bacterium]
MLIRPLPAACAPALALLFLGAPADPASALHRDALVQGREASCARLPSVQRQSIDRFVEGAIAELDLVPGLALAVVKGRCLAHQRGFGFADLEARRLVTPQTVFYTASLAKAFTGMTASVMAARGELDLDAPLEEFLPGLTRESPVHGDRVTVRDLLRHSKGFTNGAVNFRTTFVGPLEERELVRVLNGYSTPADGFTYSNTNYALTGEVIERRSGDSWRDVMDRLVFDPLAMSRSSAWASRVDPATVARPYRATRDGFRPIDFPKTDATITGAGGIFSTAHDLAAFVIANLGDGVVEGRQALPAAAVREAQAPQVDLDAEFFEFRRFAYGLGLYRARWGDDLIVHHFGGYPGFRSHLSFLPDHGIGVVVLQNEGIDGNRFADIVAAYVYDLLLGRDAEARGAERLRTLRVAVAERRSARTGWDAEVRRLSARPETAGLPLRTYAGSYTNERLGTLRIEEDGDRLRLVWGDLNGTLLPAGGNDFVMDWFFNLFGFQPARFLFSVEGGRVTGFDWGGRPFSRERSPAASPVEVLGWMAGCWARESAASSMEEVWTRPRGGIMLGVSRTVRGGAATGFEHLLLHARGDTVIYRASPSGQATTEFAATHLSDTLAVFENPRHDFPRIIAYRPAAGDSLHARVEGPGRDGSPTGFVVRYGRSRCPG